MSLLAIDATCWRVAMEALELVDPVTSTTLVPDGVCSIELALATAERATMAQHTGWAQTVSDGEKSDYISVANSHDALGSSNSTLGFYERVWVYRMRNNNGKIEIKDKYTGQHLEFNRNYLHPVRWRVKRFTKGEKRPQQNQ